MIFYILEVIFSFISGIFFLKTIVPMIESAGFTRKNYKDELIPLSTGIIFIPVIIIGFIPLMFVKYNKVLLSAYIILAVSMCLTGLIDDFLGNRDSRGFKGHIGMLLKGQLTTGGYKALFGIIVAFAISCLINTNILYICINTLTIALFTNLLNLFDLRPGRAIKAFWIMLLLLMIAAFSINTVLMLLPICIGTILFFTGDVKARYMMGDAGSNILGCTLGYLAATGCGLRVKIVVLIAVFVLNLLSEKFSFTKIIENNKLLNFIDKLGRM